LNKQEPIIQAINESQSFWGFSLEAGLTDRREKTLHFIQAFRHWTRALDCAS
jgi:hypothetical protein